MFKREITPLPEGMADSISKTINRHQYIEEKAARPADRADGDVKPQDISGEEEVKSDASAKKAPARKGDQVQADSMEKVKEETELAEKRNIKITKGDKERMVNKQELGTYKQMGWQEVKEAYMDEKSCVGEMKKLHASSCSKMEMYKKVSEKYGCSKPKFEELYAQYCNETYSEELDPVNAKAVKKKFDDRKDKDIDNDGDTDASDEYLHKRRKAISKALEEKDTHKTKDGRTAKKGLWYNINKKKERGEKPLPKGHPDRPTEQDFKDARKTTKESTENFSQPITEKMGDDDWVHIARAGSFYNPKKDKIIGYSKSPKDPNRSPKIKAGANSAMRIGDAKKKGFAIKEEVELAEAAMTRVAKELEAYARKNGGIDKMDFMKAAMMMKKGQTAQLKKFVDDLDTEPREKILSLMGKDADRRKEYKAAQKKMREEVELDEAKNYEYKDGKVHISKANFRKVHKDYKNTTRGKERMMVLDPKTQGSVSAPVVFTEAKDDYTINHKTFSSAVQHAIDVVKKRGFEVDDDEWDRKVAMGPRKPGKGKTNRYTIALTKGGKPTRKNLQMQVYYDEGRYELNMYIS